MRSIVGSLFRAFICRMHGDGDQKRLIGLIQGKNFESFDVVSQYGLSQDSEAIDCNEVKLYDFNLCSR